MKSLDDAVRQAISLAPGSMRELCRDAGIDQSLLTRIVAGERNVSPETAAKLHAALLDWSARCESAAKMIEKANT